MGHISEAWTNLALSRRELHDGLRDGSHRASGNRGNVLRAPPDCPQQISNG